MAGCGKFCGKLNRLKTLNADMLSTPLNRCLTTLDLTFLGIGYMIGPGIYVVTGTVVRDEAGTGAILSYVIAGLAATLASLCYAEFGSKIPLAGSAYTYTYVTMGEFWAFVVGWNMLLEYLIAAASSAKAWSATLDAGCNFAISKYMISVMGMGDTSWLSSYPDFIAVATIFICMIFVASGAKTSLTFNNVLSVLVVISIVFIAGMGFDNARIELWTNSTYGGFLPFGWKGVFEGSATCFYSYIGFDGIAVAGEEAIDPKRALPWATCISMLVVTVLYVLATMALTLMEPYTDLDVNAPFPVAFERLGISWAKYSVVVGSLVGITTSIIGGIYFVPRIAYSMACDGLLFPVFGQVWERTQTPVKGIFILGTLASVMALLLKLDVLVLLMSIGTLISFTFVAASVIIVRYRIDDPNVIEVEFEMTKRPTEQESETTKLISRSTSETEHPNAKHNGDVHTDTEESFEKNVDTLERRISADMSWTERLGSVVLVPGWSIFGLRDIFHNSKMFKSLGQERCVVISIIAFMFSSASFLFTLTYCKDDMLRVTSWGIVLCTIFAVGLFVSVIMIGMMSQQVYSKAFQVPLVPILPAASMFCNMGMIVMLDYFTWIRLAIWMTLGLILYGCYGYRNSKEGISLAKQAQEDTYGTITEGESKIQNGDVSTDTESKSDSPVQNGDVLSDGD